MTSLCKLTDHHNPPFVPILKDGTVKCFYCGKSLPTAAIKYLPESLLRERIGGY